MKIDRVLNVMATTVLNLKQSEEPLPINGLPLPYRLGQSIYKPVQVVDKEGNRGFAVEINPVGAVLANVLAPTQNQMIWVVHTLPANLAAFNTDAKCIHESVRIVNWRFGAAQKLMQAARFLSAMGTPMMSKEWAERNFKTACKLIGDKEPKVSWHQVMVPYSEKDPDKWAQRIISVTA